MDITDLVMKYEAGNDCGAINLHDDKQGNCSYGLFQFYAGKGIVQDFIFWCNKNYPEIKLAFSLTSANSKAFNIIWKATALLYKTKFIEAQTNYAKEKYFDIAVNQLSDKLNFTTSNVGIEAMIFSLAIQYSPYNVVTIFQEACSLLKFDSKNLCESDLDKLKHLACEIYYLRCTDEWNKGIPSISYRMMNECGDCLDMIDNN